MEGGGALTPPEPDISRVQSPCLWGPARCLLQRNGSLSSLLPFQGMLLVPRGSGDRMWVLKGKSVTGLARTSVVLADSDPEGWSSFGPDTLAEHIHFTGVKFSAQLSRLWV